MEAQRCLLAKEILNRVNSARGIIISDFKLNVEPYQQNRHAASTKRDILINEIEMDYPARSSCSYNPLIS